MDSLIDKQKIINYIEDCHLADGGYFFAKVEPSSGLDTYLAVKTLKLLGAKTKNTKSIALFWKQEEADGNLDDLFMIFLAVETFKESGLQVGVFKKYRKYLIDYYKNIIPRSAFTYSENKKLSKKSFSSAMNYLNAVGKELQDLFYLVILNYDLKIKIVDKQKITKLVVSLQNKNGGFGRSGESHLMATYYALSILKLLSFDFSVRETVYDYLIKQWDRCDFLEDLFCIVESLALIRKPLPDINKVLNFVDACQRNNGGFGRAPVMSVPTIEDTYRAVSIIKTCENYLHKKLFILKKYA
jgi:hypothetical protein